MHKVFSVMLKISLFIGVVVLVTTIWALLLYHAIEDRNVTYSSDLCNNAEKIEDYDAFMHNFIKARNTFGELRYECVTPVDGYSMYTLWFDVDGKYLYVDSSGKAEQTDITRIKIISSYDYQINQLLE